MSHIVSIKTQVTDIEAAKAACRELGWAFTANAEQFQGWQTMLPCKHKITVPGYKWEIGLIQNGAGYRLDYDHMLENDQLNYDRNADGSLKKSPDGKYVTTVKHQGAGKGCSRFVQMYAAHKATIEARKRGYMVSRIAGKNGAIQLVVTGIK